MLLAVSMDGMNSTHFPHRCGCGECKDVALAVTGSSLFWFVFYNLICIFCPRLDPDWTIRIVAGLHGTISAFMCFVSAFFLGPWPFSYIGYPPLEFHCNIIVFSCGYFIFDILWCLYMNTEELIMLLHHFFSLYGFIHVFIFNIYGCEVIAILGSSEFTNPILQFRWFMKQFGFYYGNWAKFIDFSFVFFFISARQVAGLVLLIWLCLSARMSLIAKFGGWIMYSLSMVFSIHLIMFIHRKYLLKNAKKLD